MGINPTPSARGHSFRLRPLANPLGIKPVYSSSLVPLSGQPEAVFPPPRAQNSAKYAPRADCKVLSNSEIEQNQQAAGRLRSVPAA